MTNFRTPHDHVLFPLGLGFTNNSFTPTVKFIHSLI